MTEDEEQPERTRDESTALLLDRHEEQTELRARLERGRPALALLAGRRRVGKTFLLTHAWPPEQLFLFTAARTTPQLNRRQLLHDLAAWSGEELLPEDYPTWRTVFRLLVDIAERSAVAAPPERTVMVLDEFQYLAEGDAGLAAVASELNAVWEQMERRHPTSASGGALPVIAVLAGSAVASMEALAGGGAPLYGRFA